MKILKTALIQQKCSNDKHENIEQSREMITKAAKSGARLIALQELHSDPYFCQTENPSLFDLAEPIPGPTCEILGSLAAKLGVVIVSSLFERRAPGLYHNTAVILERDGSIAGVYRKMHIPDDPGFYEKFYFAPGDLGFTPVKTSAGVLGVLVCWDQWYPEAARMMALAGAELLIYPTAIGWDPADPPDEQERQRDAWITVQRGHAIANGLPLLSINRVGFEDSPEQTGTGIVFWGSSFAADPQGKLLAQASMLDEEILFADIDLSRSEKVRRIWPFLRDRRIDAYGDILKRYRY